MTNRSATTDWDMVEAQLPANWREIADEMKVVRVQRAQLNAKVTDIRDALRLVLHHAGVGVSLRATAALAAASGVVAVSWVAVHGWMKRLGPYVAALLREMVATSAFSRERWGGFEVIGGDATTVQNPGAKGTTARVHYALRLADLTPRHIEVTDEHGGETARRFRAEPGELWLLDRAYANPGGVESIRSRGGHVVVRYNRGTLPVYDKMGNRIDVMARLYGTFEREKEHQLPAVVHAGDKRITGRLCWLRVPADKVAEARRRAVRDAGGDCDADTLHAAEYVVVFTTVRNELSAAKILELYRARWQVELEFKRSKSLEELDRLPNFRPETIYTWICAKLLLQTIARKIASPAVAFPPGGLRWQLFPPTFDAHSPRRHARGRRRAVVRHTTGVEDTEQCHPAAHAS